VFNVLFKIMINKISKLAKSNSKISDFHLRGGTNIAYREMGDIIIEKESRIENKDIEELLKKSCSEVEIKIFNTKKELDCAVMLGELRFRANFYKTLKGPAAVLRRIETKIPLMDNLALPPILYELVEAHKGLVLMTGPTGSGKSTTLAAIINQINESKPANIITIEDPVEFIHTDKKSIVSQREVGKQTESFAKALKGALREDPDVILVGELRDLETVGMALTAAETGHLVFATLHTSGAPNTINRLIDVFPPEQQGQIRAQIAESLKMVITQKLFKKKDGSGRISAFEVMVCTAPVKNLIRENKIHQIPSVMQTSQREGMITMEKSIEGLIGTGVISTAEKN
jgi:twitching motility protein PilT